MSSIRISLSALFVHQENGNYYAMNSYLNERTNELGKKVETSSTNIQYANVQIAQFLWTMMSDVMWFDATKHAVGFVNVARTHSGPTINAKNSARCEWSLSCHSCFATEIWDREKQKSQIEMLGRKNGHQTKCFIQQWLCCPDKQWLLHGFRPMYFNFRIIILQ